MVIGDGNGDNTLNIEVFAHHGNMVCSINSLIDKNNETLLATWGNIKWKNKPKTLCIAKPCGCMRAANLEKSKSGPPNH